MLLKEEKRDKAIVFFEEAYGIFHLGELATLTGMRLHRLPSHPGNRQTILQRYGISPCPYIKAPVITLPHMDSLRYHHLGKKQLTTSEENQRSSAVWCKSLF